MRLSLSNFFVTSEEKLDGGGSEITQINWILFSRAAKTFGIYRQKQRKLNKLCSAVRRNRVTWDSLRFCEIGAV
jgi:hypothetical protein